MELSYLGLRLIRHFLPEGMARFLLKHRWIIRPGLESRDPLAAVEQYIGALSSMGRDIKGKKVFVFGYGGRFAVGVELLKRGAAHVILSDHFVLLDEERNRELLPEYGTYLRVVNGSVEPHSDFITLLHGDIRNKAVQDQISGSDVILSTSVFEHLDDVEGLTEALARLTLPGGVHLHFVDLRDHYFKYPFNMLMFSESVWRNLLNPTSNLNRYRLRDYKKVFESNFSEVDIFVLAREEEKFLSAQPKIRPEFLTGGISEDSVTLIRVFAVK